MKTRRSVFGTAPGLAGYNVSRSSSGLLQARRNTAGIVGGSGARAPLGRLYGTGAPTQAVIGGGTGFSVLAPARITRILQLITNRMDFAPRIWLDRLPRVQAPDDEITAYVKTDVIAADIISDDARAVVHSSGEMRLTTDKIPNFKHGWRLSQARLRELRRIERLTADAQERYLFDDFLGNTEVNLLQGILDREEILTVQMLVDSGSYSRMGITYSGATWGMNSSVKFVPGTPWTNTAATPVNDILTVAFAGVNGNGTAYNRITLSMQCLLYAIATTEFVNQAKFLFGERVGNYFNSGVLTVPQKQSLFGQMVGMETELYDAQTTIENGDGTLAKQRFLPINSVILSSTANDGNRQAWDFAAGEILESVIASLTGEVEGPGNLGSLYGPVSYSTLADETMNPPGLILWAVDRGAPRKRDPWANGVITAFVNSTPTAGFASGAPLL